MKIARMEWSSAACAVPWAAVALVLVVAACVNQAVDLASLSFDAHAVLLESATPSINADLIYISKHLLARVAWGVPAIGFGLIAVAVVIAALPVIVNAFRDLQSRERVACAATMAVAAVCLLFIVERAGNVILSEPAVTSDLRKATLHLTTATQAVSIDTAFDTASYVIFLLLLIAASATLAWSRSATPTAAMLAQRLKQTRWLLYVGAAALVMRAIEMYMLYRWPGVWFPKEQAAAIDHMALALSTAHGAFFSAILMALYLPTAMVLRMRTQSLAAQAVDGTNEEPEAWLTKAGLSSSPFNELANVFVTIAPLIAGGSVGKVIGVLAG